MGSLILYVSKIFQKNKTFYPLIGTLNVSFLENVVYVLNERFLSFATKQRVPVLEGYLGRSETSMTEHLYELHHICLTA